MKIQGHHEYPSLKPWHIFRAIPKAVPLQEDLELGNPGAVRGKSIRFGAQTYRSVQATISEGGVEAKTRGGAKKDPGQPSEVVCQERGLPHAPSPGLGAVGEGEEVEGGAGGRGEEGETGLG